MKKLFLIVIVLLLSVSVLSAKKFDMKKHFGFNATNTKADIVKYYNKAGRELVEINNYNGGCYYEIKPSFCFNYIPAFNINIGFQGKKLSAIMLSFQSKNFKEIENFIDSLGRYDADSQFQDPSDNSMNVRYSNIVISVDRKEKRVYFIVSDQPKKTKKK
jgi:hypothetical protein